MLARGSRLLQGSSSFKWWQPCTLGMVAGLTGHVWTSREVLLVGVPPWPPPQTV